MVYEVEFLDFIQDCEIGHWEGEVFRHMLGENSPFRENTGGARWNPPETAAIYASLTRETALAEAEYRLQLETVRPRSKRTLYRIKVSLTRVIHLGRKELEHLGVDEEVLRAPDFSQCQVIGGAVAFMEYAGLIVPSVRHRGENLVVYPRNQSADCLLEVLEEYPL